MKIYKKIGSKERLFELMQVVNKVKLNENWDQQLNNTLMTAIEKLKSGALNLDQGGTNRTAMQSVNDVSYVGINGYDAEKNMYNFNFKIIGNEGDQDGVFNVDDVILEKFYFQNPQGEKVFDVDENQLVNFNKQYGSQLYDIIEKYVGEDLQPAGEFDEMSENYGNYSEEWNDYKKGDRLRDSEGNVFVIQSFDIGDDTVGVDLRGYGGSKSISGLDLKFYEKTNDIMEDLKFDKMKRIDKKEDSQPYGGSKKEFQDGMGYGDEKPVNPKLRVKAPELEKFVEGEEENGENLIKKNYNALSRDLDFTKLADAYENLLKIKHGEFRGTDAMQNSLSSIRNTLVEYLKSVRNLSVSDMDVQNYFENMISKFSSVMSEEEDEKESPEGWKDVDGVFKDDGGVMKWTEKSEEPETDDDEIPVEEPVEEPETDVPSLDPEDIDGDGDMIKGGLADDADVGQYDPEQVLMGMEVEMEHTDDPKVALEIAMDHLEEHPDYYTRLDAMEKEADADSELPGIGTDNDGMPIPVIEPPAEVVDSTGIPTDVEPPESDDKRSLLMDYPELQSEWEDEMKKDRELEDELLGFNIDTPNVPKQDGSGMGIGANKGRGCEVEEDFDFAAQEREHEDKNAYNRFQELDSKGFDDMSDEEKEEFYKLWVEFGKDNDNEY